MNTIYTLSHPIKSRRNGQDVMLEELPLPEVITVGQFRRAGPTANQMLWAHQITEVCAGLNAIDASKLLTPDALGYAAELAELLTPFDEPGLQLPEIRPVKALVQRLSVGPDNPVEFAAQVLLASGVKRETLDAMDVRAFLPAVQPVLGAMSDPK